MTPGQLGMQGIAAMYSNAHVWMQAFDCCCNAVQQLMSNVNPTCSQAFGPCDANVQLLSSFFIACHGLTTQHPQTDVPCQLR